MALPATMKVLGLGLGIALIIFMAILTEASIELLLESLLQVCVLVNNVGVLIVYMIIIGDVLSGTSSSGVHHYGVLEGWFGDHWWNGHSLKFTSALSVAFAVVFLVITVGISIVKLISGGIQMPRLLPDVTDLTSVFKLFTVVPVLVTAYICHYNVHSIDNELEDSTQIKGVVRTSLALCSTVSLLNDAVRVSYAAHLMLVFPIVFYPLRLNMDGLLFPSSRPLASSNVRFALITAGLITVIFLGANFIPSIWDAFQFTGATAAVCIGFIFPAAITLRDRHHIATKKDKILSVFMIVLAVFSNLVAIYSDAYSLFKKNPSPRE
ncbi:hypothetical protein Patl1_21582 [Pistacia atlantica]|uniref:Uncharacterized protein n=1 Tax=Pistacia atlantica TaxID=434234 RepID=A0ACC1BKP2_9ROSI|nr:hypothetical protein Patl1_21582 [Pistacia atlantica]